MQCPTVTKLLFVVLLLIILILPVLASEDMVQIPTNAVTAHASSNRSAIEVHQGSPDMPEIIYWGETVDLTLVEGWYGIVERYPGGELVDVSAYSHRIFVDPAIFPTGTYYQWSPEGIFGHGNNIAFQVSSGTRPTEQYYVLNTSEGVEIPVLHEKIENLPLPSVKAADYLVAHGDPLSIHVNESKGDLVLIWLFQDGMSGIHWEYPRFGNITVNFTESDTENLHTGNYTILIQYLGKNKVADVMYANFSRERVGYGYDDVIYSPFGGKNTTVSGWVSYQVKNEVKKKLDEGMWINQSGTSYNLFDDEYETRSLTIAEPFSDIRMIDEYYRSDSFENASTVRVAGYTNLKKGSILSILLDKDKQIGAPTSTTQNAVAVGDDPGEWRQFVVLYPVYYKDLEGGGKEHSFTVFNPDGSNTTASYHVYDIPQGQVRPLQTIRYIAGNEFKPTPTPEIVESVVTVTVTIPVVEKREVVKYVEVTPWYFTLPWVVVWIILAAIVYYLYWRLKK